MKRFLKSVIAAGMAVVMLAGCGGSKDSTSSASDEGKVIVIGSGQTCATLDPTNSYDGWYPVRFGVCQTLTKMNNDMSISGWLAEDNYTSDEEHTTWTFTIKSGIQFSNGTALTAEAVKASLENVFAKTERGTEYFTPVSIEADGQTLTINTAHPEPILPNKLADPLFCIIDTSVDMANIADEGPIGTGPFVVESFDALSRECIVVKNTNYSGDEPQADKIRFVYTEDQSALSMGLQTGDFDAVYNVSMNDIDQFEGNDEFTVVRTASGRTTHGFMNQNGPLGDIVLRQVILQYVDREGIVANTLHGQYVAGKTLITSSADYGFDVLTDPNAYNPENAVKMLDEAGYVDIDGDGFRETPDGEQIDLKFVYYTGRPEQQVVVDATQMMLSEIGIKITPDLKETQQVIDKLAVGDYDLLCMSINVLNCADPENHMNTYFKTGGSYQAYGWKNDKFDSIMDELSVTSGAAERRELIMEAEQILLDDAVCIYFCYPLMNFTMHKNVSNIYSTPADYYWVDEYTTIQ